jgi:hypothetical protein
MFRKNLLPPSVYKTSFTLKMEAACSSETLTVYKIRSRRVPEEMENIPPQL